VREEALQQHPETVHGLRRRFDGLAMIQDLQAPQADLLDLFPVLVQPEHPVVGEQQVRQIEEALELLRVTLS